MRRRLIALALGLLAACAEHGPAPKPPAPVDLADTAAWTLFRSDGARGWVESDTEGLALGYELPSGGGWTAIDQRLHWRVRPGAMLVVDARGTGAANLEIKLLGSNGAVYGKVLPLAQVKAPLRLGYDDLRALHGSPAPLDLVTAFGIAVSGPAAAKGRVVIRSVTTSGITSGEDITYFPRFEVTGLTDDQVLDEIERRTVKYFWETLDPKTGVGIDYESTASDTAHGKVAATGFGLAALVIGIERGWIPREAGYERVLATLRFFDNTHGPDGWVRTSERRPRAEGRWGLWFHFVNRHTGAWDGGDCVALCDSADLVAGIVVCRQYFKGTEVEKLATRMLDSIEWDRFIVEQGGKRLLSFGYLPKGGSTWYPNDPGDRLLGAPGMLCDNSLLFNFMAMGSRTHAVPVSVWADYVSTAQRGEYGGYSCLVAPPAFCRQVPLAFIDARGWRDRGIDYFADIANATMAQRQYGIDVKHYHKDLWGFDDCITSPGGSYSHGAPPGEVKDDGTVATAGFAAAVPFVPGPALAALRYALDRYSDRILGPYGLTASLNLDQGFFCPEVFSIGAGPTVIAMENHRSGLIWRLFMADPIAQTALKRIGFVPVIDDFELPAEAPAYAGWSSSDATLSVIAGGAASGARHLLAKPKAGAQTFSLICRPRAADRAGFPALAFATKGSGTLTVEVGDATGRKVVLVPQPAGEPTGGWQGHRCALPQGMAVTELTFRIAGARDEFRLDDIRLERS